MIFNIVHPYKEGFIRYVRVPVRFCSNHFNKMLVHHNKRSTNFVTDRQACENQQTKGKFSPSSDIFLYLDMVQNTRH